MANKSNPSLTKAIVIGTLLGVTFGSLLNILPTPAWLQIFIVDGVLEVGGKLFLSSLRLLVIPLIFVSLVTGVAGLRDASQIGRIGVKTLGFFIASTALALVISLGVAMSVSFSAPGALSTNEHTFTPPESPSLTQTIINLFPTNPIEAMARGETLQVIVFALLFGYALTITPKSGKPILDFFSNLNQVLLDLILLLIKVAPVGVFCLLAKTFAEQGFSTIVPLAKYFFVLLGILIFHGTVVYGGILKVFAGISPLKFFKRYAQVPIFAFSTSSSNATMPVTLEVAEKRLGVSPKVASFTVPLGATINMDGTSIMQGVATVFIAQAYGVDLSVFDLLTVVLTATLASIGTAGVPGVGIIMLAMVLQQVNIPIEGIGLILGVDRLLDMVRTSVNVTGDAVASILVAKSEGQWDREIFEGTKEFEP